MSVSEISTEFKARFEFKVKNHTLKAQIYALNLWILRCAQYDKIYKFNKICKYDKNLEHKKRLRDCSLNLLWIAAQIFAKFARNDEKETLSV